MGQQDKIEERLRIDREQRIADLLKVGFISPDEALTYKERLTALPTDRSGLVVAYFIKETGVYKETAPSIYEHSQIVKTIASFHLSDRAGLYEGKTIAESLTEAERERFINELSSIRINGEIRKAETFVDVARKRIRGSLLNILSLEIALSLASPKPQEGELDTIPNLRTFLKGKGYREDATSLNDGEREAIKEAAVYYLDLLELAYLSGIGELRSEEYKDYLSEDGSRWEKTYHYKDVYDEALTEYGGIYALFEEITGIAYKGSTPQEAIDYLRVFLKGFYEVGAKGRYDTLKGGKFFYLLEEEGIC